MSRKARIASYYHYDALALIIKVSTACTRVHLAPSATDTLPSVFIGAMGVRFTIGPKNVA